MLTWENRWAWSHAIMGEQVGHKPKALPKWCGGSHGNGDPSPIHPLSIPPFPITLNKGPFFQWLSGSRKGGEGQRSGTTSWWCAAAGKMSSPFHSPKTSSRLVAKSWWQQQTSNPCHMSCHQGPCTSQLCHWPWFRPCSKDCLYFTLITSR